MKLEDIDKMSDSNEKGYEYFKKIIRINQVIRTHPNHTEKYMQEKQQVIDRLKDMLPNQWRLGIYYAENAKSVKDLK